MRRDNELIRNLLMEFESSEEFLFVSFITKDEDPDRDRRHYHILLLCDAGLLAPVGRTSFRLTNAAHDFLEALRDEGIWQRTKEAVARTGGNATLEIIRQIAVGFLTKQIRDRTGLDL